MALDGDLDEIVLCRYVERDDIAVETLEQELDEFLKVLETWKKRCDAGEIGSLRSSVAAAPEPDPGSRIIRG